MDSKELVVSVLEALPNHTVKGKKRLQKLVFLLKEAGVRCSARFDIRDYGPFSREVASAADFLAAIGKLSEKEEPLGASGTFVTIYQLKSEVESKPLQEKYKAVLRSLEKFQTVDLEVASTFQYFRSQGFAQDSAKQKTITLKPTKATAAVWKNVPKILDCLKLHS